MIPERKQQSDEQTSQDEQIPLAAVALSARQLTKIRQIYPHFPLDVIYNLVLLDPPWKYGGTKFKPSYRTLSVEDISVLPIPHITKADSILLIWVTGPMKATVHKVIEKWKFKYIQTIFHWNKVRDGKAQMLPGVFSDTSVEELLVAVRGQYHKYINEEARVPQVVASPATKHSEKPRVIMDLIAKKFKLNKMRSLEVFARQRTLPQFDLYGDELHPPYQTALTVKGNKNANYVMSNLETLMSDNKFVVYKLQKNNGLQQSYAFLNPNPLYLMSLDITPAMRQERLDSLSTSYMGKLEVLMDEAQKRKFRDLIDDYVPLFAFNKKEFGLTDVLQHHINLEPDAKPVAKNPYKVAPIEDELIEKEIATLKELNCIEESNSQWASPIVLVRKANGEPRMCIDYRGLNKVTVRDLYPLPRIDQILLRTCQGKVFSKLDLKSGFWQVSVYYYDRPKTSFVSRSGTYQWKRMPFGLTNAPATFQRLMTQILKEFINDFLIVYIDDIIVFSNSIEEHNEHLRKIFDALTFAGLKLGHDKCTFFKKEIEILGHRVTHGSYKPLESRVQAITQMQAPKNMKDVQIFLGLVNYHGQFIKDLAKIAKPLRLLTKKDEPFVWSSAQEEAFQKLKYAIATNPILHVPLTGKLMILYTDFSNLGIGAVLAQEIAPNEERVIEYQSRTLRAHEVRYPAYKGEVLAVSWAVAKFRQYLLQAPFRLVLDNLAAVQLLQQYKTAENLNNLQRTVLNWVLELQDYNFVPVHRAGVSHNNADALSRLPRLDDEVLSSLRSKFTAPYSYEFTQFELDYALNWWGAKEEMACIKCQNKNDTSANAILICDCCGKFIHQRCQTPQVKVIPPGPWYCYECIQSIESFDEVDPTLDFHMLEFLKTKEMPKDYTPQQQTALMEKAKEYCLEGVRLKQAITFRVVPTITERKILLNQIHDHKGHCQADQLLDAVEATHWWPTMKRDCQRFVALCVHCSQMNPKFISNPSLHPTEKGQRPFSVLHVDLSGDLQLQPTSRKNRYFMLIVDAFSKWVELYPIPNSKAATTATVMWDFVKRFGAPTTVVSDKGTEFKGEFEQILSDMRVKFITISPRNPQANGMAERTIKTVKMLMRRFVTSPTQNVEWDEAIHSVQTSINSSTSQSTRFSPYEIVFGRKMDFPSSVVVDPPLYPFNEPSQQEVDAYVRDLKETFKIMHPTCFMNIRHADDRNKQLYDQRHSKSQTELKFGDFVMVKQTRVLTLGKTARGPFMFLRYLNKDKHSAELINPYGLDRKKIDGKEFISAKTFKESTSNIAPVLINREELGLTDQQHSHVVTISIREVKKNYGNYLLPNAQGFMPLDYHLAFKGLDATYNVGIS